jgi:cytoskeletal protein CcmA (bactofilin family)
MLANDGFSLKLGGVSQEDINLGDDLNFAGTSNEVEIAYDSASNTLTFGLPSSIQAALVGNATTASAWQSSRTISLAGDLGGSVSIDGSADATLTATIQAGSVDNSMLANSAITVGDGTNSEAISLGQAISIQGTSNEVEVAYDSATNAFSVGLPSSISGLSTVSASAFSGALSGNASTASTLETSRTLSVSGDASGSVSFDGSANADIALTIASGAVENSMLANDGISLQLGGVAQEDINLGDSLNFTGTSNEVEVAYSAASNTLTFGLPSTISAALSGNASTASTWESSRTISLAGDLGGSVSLNGSSDVTLTATIQSGSVENSMLANSGITVGDGSSSESIALGGSLVIAGTSNEVEVSYDTATDTFTVGLPSTITVDVNGNASTASALETSRTIALTGDVTGSVGFDGSSNVSISTTLAGGTALTFSDGSNSEALALGSTLTVQGTSNEVEVAYSTANDAFTIGLPSTITADLSGNASSADALSTSRTIALTGDVTGSGSFDGSSNLSISTTLAGGTALTFSDGTNSEALALGSTLTVQGTANEVEVAYSTAGDSFTVGLPDDVTIAGDLTVTGTINATIEGTADQANSLSTARTISLGGDLGGSVSFDGSADVSLTATIQTGSVENSMLANDHIGLKLGGVAQENIALGDDLDFVSGTDIDVTYNSTSNALTFALEAEIASDTTGNAATASALETARTLSVSGDASGSVSFDGSADADIALTIAAGAVDNAMLANDGISLLVDSVSQEDINLGDSLNFISGTDIDIAYNTTTNQLSFGLESEIGSDTTGNAATASAWATARTISLGGDLGGSVSVDGSADATLTATIQSGSVENSMLANSGVTLAADSGSNDPVALGETITISGTANEIETAAAGSNQITIGLPDNVTVGNNLTVSNDLTVSSGDMELTDGTLSILGGGASISGTVTINGTHTINGSLIANSATMKFEDSLLELGYTNSSAVDHGFFSKHSDGDYVGVAYDQSASEFAMFKTGTKPAATVDTAAGDYELANARMGDLNASAMIASSALVNNGSQVQFNKLSFASVSGTDTTLSGSQIVGGVILRDATSDETDATATAAQIVAAMPASARVADMTFEVKIIVSNSSAGYNFTAGSGVTIVGSSSYLVDGVHNYLVRVTNATVSSEAVTFYKA